MSTDRYAPNVSALPAPEKNEKPRAVQAVVLPLHLFPSGMLPGTIYTLDTTQVREANGSQEFERQPYTTWWKKEDALLMAFGFSFLTFVVTAVVAAIIAH